MDTMNKPKEILLASLRGVADDLARGNDKSKRMARILNLSGDILGKSEAKFDRVWSELYDVYADMSKIHNKMYEAVGGKIGTGEFVGMDLEEADAKSGIALTKLLDGVDAEGYMKLQVGIGQIRNLLSLSSNMPFQTSESTILGKVEHIYWLALMSVYEYSHQEKVLKILNKYDPKAS
jgi:hypothetical protein